MALFERDESTATDDGFSCYKLHMTDRRFKVYDDRSFGSLHTIPLKANRSYIASILMDADFQRPAEINAGELVYGVGVDWPFIQYSASQYRKANCIGVMKGDAWEGMCCTVK